MIVIRNKFIIKLLFTVIILVLYNKPYVSGFTFNLIGSVGGIYDDNVYLSEENKETDIIANLMIGFVLKNEQKVQVLDLSGHAYQRLYLDNPDLNNNYQDIQLNYECNISSSDSIRIADIFLHYPEPLQFANLFGRIDNRKGYYNNALTVNYRKILTSQFIIDARYNNNINRYITGNLTNSIQNGAGTSLNYQLSSISRFSIFYDYLNASYETGETNYKQSPGAGLLQYVIHELIYFEVKYGMSFIKSYDDRNYRKPFIYAMARYNIDENNDFVLAYSRDYGVTIDNPEPFQSWRSSCDFNRQLFPRLNGTLSAFYGEGEYVTTNTQSKFIGFSILFNYLLTETLNLHIQYLYINNEVTVKYPDETEASSGYERNQITFSAIKTF